MTRAATVFPAAIFVVVAGLLAVGFFILNHSWTVIKFPFLAGVIVCALCLIELWVQLRGAPPERGSGEPAEPMSLASVAWIFALLVFLYGLGFVFGSAAYLFAYLRATGSSWRLSAAMALGSLLMTWVVFIKVLRILLPLEPLWWG
ncbi:MAG: tripartite tricarboxylate transporter TctB family protein [Bradyrhizobium sp.]